MKFFIHNIWWRKIKHEFQKDMIAAFQYVIKQLLSVNIHVFINNFFKNVPFPTKSLVVL